MRRICVEPAHDQNKQRIADLREAEVMVSSKQQDVATDISSESKELSLEERIEKVRRDAYAAGFAVGEVDGFIDGYNQGFATSYDESFAEGHTIGFAQGYQQGLAKGEKEGFDNGLIKGRDEGFEAGKPKNYDLCGR